MGAKLLEYLLGFLGSVGTIVSELIKILQGLNYQEILESLATHFSYFGNYHLLGGNYAHLCSSHKPDEEALEEHLSLQLESKALQDEGIVRQVGSATAFYFLIFTLSAFASKLHAQPSQPLWSSTDEADNCSTP